MRYANSIRLVVFSTPDVIVRALGDDQLWMADPTDGRAWLAAEEPVDLRKHR